MPLVDNALLGTDAAVGDTWYNMQVDSENKEPDRTERGSRVVSGENDIQPRPLAGSIALNQVAGVGNQILDATQPFEMGVWNALSTEAKVLDAESPPPQGYHRELGEMNESGLQYDFVKNHN